MLTTAKVESIDKIEKTVSMLANMNFVATYSGNDEEIDKYRIGYGFHYPGLFGASLLLNPITKKLCIVYDNTINLYKEDNILSESCIQPLLISINSLYGNIISENCSVRLNNIWIIDIMIQITTVCGSGRQLLSVADENGNLLASSNRLDILCTNNNTERFLIYDKSISCFIVNGSNFDVGVYKITTIINNK